MNQLEESLGAQPCVYTTGGLFGELLQSLFILSKLGIKAIPTDKKFQTSLSSADIQSMIINLLTENQFPNSSLCLAFKDNPEIGVEVDDY